MTEPTLLERWRDVSVIEGRHTPILVEGLDRPQTICSRCQEIWPCDAARMVRHLGAIQAEAEK